jgi:hypothetical protein
MNSISNAIRSPDQINKKTLSTLALALPIINAKARMTLTATETAQWVKVQLYQNHSRDESVKRMLNKVSNALSIREEFSIDAFKRRNFVNAIDALDEIQHI